MEHFWGEVSKIVQNKIGLNAESYIHSLEEQKETIIKFLTFNCYPDSEDEVKEIKKEILKLYTENIAHLISKFEVYEHDLDPVCVEALFDLMQIIATAELTENVAEKKKCYDYALKLAYFIKHMSHILLIDCYVERIKHYKKSLRNFNRNGIEINGEKFDDVVKRQYNKAIGLYKKSKCIYQSYLQYDFVTKTSFLCYSNIESDIGLEEVADILEKIIDTYEEQYPKIINSGYNWSIAVRLFNLCIDIFSFGFLVYGFLKLLI